MNNLGFNKNAFTPSQTTKIASKVVTNNNVGRVSVNEIRSNMNSIGRENINVQENKEVMDNSLPQRTQMGKSEVERMRIQAFKNIGRR